MPTYEIACGAHKGTIEAEGPGAAWRKLTGNKTADFAPIARFREVGGGQYPVWHYISPEGFDELKP